MITDKFNFVHIPRTGGTTVHHIIKKSGAKVINEENHMPLMEELTIRNQPSFTIIRNPFEWYQSWYGWLKATDRFNGSFEGYMQKIASQKRSRRMLNIVPYNLFGTFSACWNYFVGAESSKLIILQYESLHEYLPLVLNDLGGIHVRHTLPLLGDYSRRTGERPQFPPWAAEMVEDVDGYMLERFGYEEHEG